MGEVHLTLDPEVMPRTNGEIIEYLTTMACVHPERGTRRMPTELDDKVFDAAAREIKRLERTVDELKAALLKQVEQLEFLLKLSTGTHIHQITDGKRVRKSLRAVLANELPLAAKAARDALDQKL